MLQVMCSVHISMSYVLIKNQVSDLIFQLLTINGLNVAELMDFLNTILKTRNCGIFDNLYMLLLGCSEGPLLESVYQGLYSSISFDEFHQSLLNSFVPS